MRLPVLAVVLALGSSALSASPAEAASAARPYDFNGDGYPELVVGAPTLQVGSVKGAGGVVILPASAGGLSLTERVITQSSRGVPGSSETGDLFGGAVASADFDRDGYADLAVGHPGENGSAGAVTVIYGSSRGLDTSRSRRMSPVSDGGFGFALVAGDFNRDRFQDLAVSAPYVDPVLIPGTEDDLSADGAVMVMSGGSAGLSSADRVVLRRQAAGGNYDSAFGWQLAAGDLDGDGGTDLIVHSFGDADEHHGYPGSISYCRGRVGGPNGCARLVHDQVYAGPVSLAVGNMSGDSRPEIVVGLPDIWGYGGNVQILRLGAGAPLAVVRETSLTQDSPGVPGSQEAEDAFNCCADEFGSSVALGDIDRDGYADLVIGATGENDDRGRVTVVHGAAAGWRTSGNYFYSQNTRGIPGVAETGDGFGSNLALRDHNRDGRLDLTVSAVGENGFSGAITTLRGSGRGFTTSAASTFGLATLGYAHPAGAQFGFPSPLGR